jgi:hypothetical protein
MTCSGTALNCSEAWQQFANRTQVDIDGNCAVTLPSLPSKHPSCELCGFARACTVLMRDIPSAPAPLGLTAKRPTKSSNGKSALRPSIQVISTLTATGV